MLTLGFGGAQRAGCGRRSGPYACNMGVLWATLATSRIGAHVYVTYTLFVSDRAFLHESVRGGAAARPRGGGGRRQSLVGVLILTPPTRGRWVLPCGPCLRWACSSSL